MMHVEQVVETKKIAKRQTRDNDKKKKKTTSISSTQFARAKERKKSS